MFSTTDPHETWNAAYPPRVADLVEPLVADNWSPLLGVALEMVGHRVTLRSMLGGDGGRKLQREIKRREREVLGPRGPARFPFIGDDTTTAVGLIESYAELVAVAMARARFLGALLAEQFDQAQLIAAESGESDYRPLRPRDGDPAGLGGPATAAGLIGYTYSGAVVGMGEDASYESVATGEEVRGLVRLEAEERDRAARLIRDALRIGLDLEKIEVMRGYAQTAATAMRALIGELGLDVNAEPVLRAAGRAGLTARRALGHDDGDPDVHAGPALTLVERQHVLDDALARIRR